MANDEEGMITFYARNKPQHEGDTDFDKYSKYYFYTTDTVEKTGGYGGNLMMIGMSDGNLYITNCLWYSAISCNRLPKNALKGTIYNKRSDEPNIKCYIYDQNKSIVKKGIFKCDEKAWFDMDEEKK
jgi:hypothetical protein